MSEAVKGVNWTPEKQKRLQEIGKSIMEKLNKIPLPVKPVYPRETSEILRIWDEDEVIDLRNFGSLNEK